MFKKLMFLGAALLFAISTASAQGLGFGPQVGYYKAKDADKGNVMVGAALRLKLTSSFGIEGSINYRQEEYADGALKVRSWPVMATALFYPLPIVYGAAGAGWYNTTFDYDQSKLGFTSLKDETKQEVGWHFGGGLEIPFGSHSKLAADIRYVFIDYEFGQLPGSKDLKSNFYVVTVGYLMGL